MLVSQAGARRWYSLTSPQVQHSVVMSTSVISQSFGVGETCAGSAYLQQEQLVFSEARAKHITMLASSGDSGAAVFICPSFSLGKGVNLPAADPLVTSVGGTSLDATVGTG